MPKQSRWEYYGGEENSFTGLSKRGKIWILFRSGLMRLFAFEVAIFATSLLGLPFTFFLNTFPSNPLVIALVFLPVVVIGATLLSLILLIVWESASTIRKIWSEFWLLYTPNGLRTEDDIEERVSLPILANLPHSLSDYERLEYPVKEDMFTTFRTGYQATFLIIGILSVAFYLDSQGHIPATSSNFSRLIETALSTVLAPIKAFLNIAPLFIEGEGEIKDYTAIFFLGAGISFTPFAKNYVRHAQITVYKMMDDSGRLMQIGYTFVFTLIGCLWIYALLFGY